MLRFWGILSNMKFSSYPQCTVQRETQIISAVNHRTATFTQQMSSFPWMPVTSHFWNYILFVLCAHPVNQSPLHFSSSDSRHHSSSRRADLNSKRIITQVASLGALRTRRGSRSEHDWTLIYVTLFQTLKICATLHVKYLCMCPLCLSGSSTKEHIISVPSL